MASIEEALALYEDAETGQSIQALAVSGGTRTNDWRPSCPTVVPSKYARSRQHGETITPWELRALAIHEAKIHEVPPYLFLAIISAESCWNLNALGKAREISLVQMLHSTYADLREQGLVKGNPWHPKTNLHAGAVYLRQIIESFTKRELTLAYRTLGLSPYAVVAASYNAGPTAVKEAITGHRELPASTLAYVQAVRELSKREKVLLEKTRQLKRTSHKIQ